MMRNSKRSRPMPPEVWFLAPALSLIGVFFFLPVAASLLLAFTDFDIYALGDLSRLRFVGLENYRHLLHDPRFWIALRNTLYFSLVGAPLSIGVSLGMALLVNHRLTRYREWFRSLLFLPVVTTLVAVAVVWRYLFHPGYGYLNYMLSWVGIDPIDWLGDPTFALPALILMAVWKNFGFNMILFVAGLQHIPRHLYEAAALDGADELAQFRHITLPMLAPTLGFVTLVTLIGHFQLFAEPYVMTQGGPADSTLSVALLMFQEGFRWWNLGYAAAVAFVLFLIILTATLVLTWLRDSRA